jgi:hypothetical protein
LHIRFQSDGGLGYFPGLDEPLTIDTADLPPEEAARFEGLIGAADFFSRPETIGSPSPPGAADLRHHTISVDDDHGRSHTVEVTEPVVDAAIQALIDALRGAGKSAREH